MTTDPVQPPESPAQPLVVRIPRPSSSSSVDSPLNSSPTTSILALPRANSASSSSSTSSATSPSTTLSVKFAPLPDLSKRKKRYHHPLGVAARSEIMRRRKAAMEGTGYLCGDDNEQDTGSSCAEVQAGYHRRHPHARRTVMGDEEEVLLEDPLLTIGRMVKGASKSLWRKVSHRRIERPVSEGESDSEGGRVGADGAGQEMDEPITDAGVAPVVEVACTIEGDASRAELEQNVS